MRILEMVLGILCAAYSMVNVVPLAVTFGAKASWIRLPAELSALAPLVKAVAWWQAVVWLAVVVLYLTVAWLLMVERPAFGMFLVALIFDGIRWIPMQRLAEYRLAFTSGNLQVRYIGFALLAVIGVLTLWIDHVRGMASGLQGLPKYTPFG
jgi:hypothetical protein